MRELYFDLWPGDDIKGTATGELTQAYDRRYRKVDQGVDLGSFVINRNDSQWAWINAETEPLIRVRRVPGGPFAYDDARYKGAFWAEVAEVTTVSPKEQGGQESKVSGRGIEAILDRAVINEVATHPDDVGDIYDRTVPVDGMWHIDGAIVDAGTHGAVMRIFLRNAETQTPEPMPELTHDFTTINDSNGDPWSFTTAKWSFPVGTELGEVLGSLVASGAFYDITPDVNFSMWKTHQGVDRTATVTVAVGKSDDKGNVAGPAGFTLTRSQGKSRVLVEGDREAGGAKVFQWVTDTGLEADIGVRQGGVRFEATPTTGLLTAFGEKYLADRARLHSGLPNLPYVETDGNEALLDYDVGDTITLDVPGLPATAMVKAVTLVQIANGNADPIIEFEDVSWTGPRLEGAVHPAGGDCPFFFPDIPAALARFRDPFTGIGATGGVQGDTDAYVRVQGDGSFASVDIFTYGPDGEAEIIMGDNGEFISRGSIIWEANIDEDSDPAVNKFWFVGGWGLVFSSGVDDQPDPSAGDSEPGQLRYVSNDGDGKFHYHDSAGVWQTLATGTGSGSAYTPVTVYAECNAPGAASADGPVGNTIEWDTFYDVAFADLGIPASLGPEPLPGIEMDAYPLDGFLECTKAGLYAFAVTADPASPNPDDDGILRLNISAGYLSSPVRRVLTTHAIGNYDQYEFPSFIVAMVPGDRIRLIQWADTIDPSQLVSYAAMSITRLADDIA